MLVIRCPHCGPRPHVEFTHGGAASIIRPSGPAADSIEAWIDYVYLRDNVKGPQREYWQHVLGCRAWIVVERDTLSHAIRVSDAAHGGG